MTREHKLALIVGFSILLLVGVLISDHLSRAREARLDPVLEPAATVDPVANAVPVDPLGPVVRRASADLRGLGPAAQAPAGPTESATAQHAPESIAANVAPAEPAAALGGNGTLESELAKAGGTITTRSDGVREITFGQAPPPAPKQPEAAVAAAAPDKTHVVKKNETLFAISKAYYGDAALWPMLAAYNKDRVGRNGGLREGQSIRIPARAVLTGTPDPAPAAPVPSGKPPSTETRIASARTYVVKKDDTLGDVSKAVYGTSRRWRDILAANRSLIDDEDMLRVGMVLKVPG